MAKGKARGRATQVLVHKEAYQRMNFLYQAAILSLIQHPQNPSLSRMYVRTMKSVSQKLVLKIDPSIKRTICKSCDSLLVPGLSCVHRLKSRRERHVTVTCLSCGSCKRYLSRKNQK